MANVMRWLKEPTKARMFVVDDTEVIEIGDLVYLDTDDVKAADQQSDQGSLIANQDKFKQGFAGVAMQAHDGDGATEIRVAMDGVFRFICAEATFEVGDLVGIAEASSGTALENQTVIAVDVASAAIGIVAKRAAANVTEVEVDIESTVATYGGISEQVAGSGS